MGNSENERKKKEESSSKKNNGRFPNKVKSTKSHLVLDIPEFEYENVKEKLRELKAHVSVDARLGKIIKIQVGAEADMDKVDIEINNVKSEAQLIINLERIKEIIDITGGTVDKTRQALEPLLAPIAGVIGESLDDLSEKVLKSLTGISSYDKKELDKAIRSRVTKTVIKRKEVNNKKHTNG